MTAIQRVSRGVSPWSPIETGRALLLVLVGFAVVVGAWSSLADEATWDDQIPYLGVAIAGLALGAFGAVSWLLRARAQVLARRRALLPDLAAAAARLSVAGGSSDDELVADRSRCGRYHRASCALAAGKGWRSKSRVALVADGREPCGVCQP